MKKELRTNTISYAVSEKVGLDVRLFDSSFEEIEKLSQSLVGWKESVTNNKYKTNGFMPTIFPKRPRLVSWWFFVVD